MSKKKRNIKNKNNIVKERNYKNNLDFEIFKYLSPDSNTKLSELKGLDLQDLIILLNNFYLSLRKTLDIEKNVTFGLEIEVEHCSSTAVERQINNKALNLWEVGYDGSIDSGAEIKSPIMSDNPGDWKDLNKICQIIKKNGYIDSRCGGHIHVGAHILNNNSSSLLNFVKLWAAYENIFYRFLYGEYLNHRPRIKEYALPMQYDFYKFYIENRSCDNTDDLLELLREKRYIAVNFDNVQNMDEFEADNTIEFRCPNGTLEPAIWQNNVNLCIKLLQYACNKQYNNDLINKRFADRLTDKELNLTLYSEIYLEQVLELCDLLFNNNVDKIYFLKQYLKSLDTPRKEFQKAKKFVL